VNRGQRTVRVPGITSFATEAELDTLRLADGTHVSEDRYHALFAKLVLIVCALVHASAGIRVQIEWVPCGRECVAWVLELVRSDRFTQSTMADVAPPVKT
jgi:hypothetical protein